MSDERKELTKALDIIWSRFCSGNLNNLDDISREEKAVEEIRNIIQNPERKIDIDDMKKYVDEKARKLHDGLFGRPSFCSDKCEDLILLQKTITQIVSELNGAT